MIGELVEVAAMGGSASPRDGAALVAVVGGALPLRVGGGSA